MTKLIKSGAYAQDNFVPVADDAALPDGAVLVSLARFQKDRDALLARNTPIGVKLASDQNPQVLADDLSRLSLVALEFPRLSVIAHGELPRDTNVQPVARIAWQTSSH